MTCGELRARLTQQFPTLSLELIENWILDRYTAILDRLDWSRQQVQAILATTAAYTDGTLDATNGSAALAGTGTAWTAAMSGCAIRIAGRNEFYQFTRTGAGTGTIERGYEGATGTGLAYRIFESIYPLPSDCKILGEIRSFQTGEPLERVSLTRLNELDAARATYGNPEMYALTLDDGSDPPRAQVELWPAPTSAVGLPIIYTAELAAISGTSTTILPWVRPAALIAGVSQDACLQLALDKPEASAAYLALAAQHERKYEAAISDMTRTECLARGAEPMHMAERFTRHRNRRWTR